jgi:O-antigen ligase
MSLPLAPSEVSVGSAQPIAVKMRGTGIAYSGVLLFTLAYFVRVEEIFPIMKALHLAIIGGALSIVGLIISLAQTGKLTRTKEPLLLLLLLAWFVVLMFTSSWPGGTFKVFNDYIWKAVAISITLMNVVDSYQRIRHLIIIQCVSIGLIAWLSRNQVDDATGRLLGASGAFGNPNDLAIVLALTLPLSFYLFIIFQSALLKLVWAIVAIVLCYVSVLTLSRSGFLALLSAVLVLAIHFGVKTGKKAMIVGIVVGTILVLVIAAPESYTSRIQSIFNSELDGPGIRSDATGSRESRRQLMIKSIETTIKNPVFGVGPGQFAEASGSWHVSHNIFLQFSTECGLPGLFIFLLLLSQSFRNLRRAETSLTKMSEGWILVGALRASLVAFLVGSFFSNFGYLFLTYFLFSLTAALNQVTRLETDSRYVQTVATS